jgi:phenylacetate-CoA ligase
MAHPRDHEFGIAVHSREEVEAIQWRKISRLLERIYTQSSFYRRRLDAVGAQPYKIKSLAHFREAIPLMRKEDVLADQQNSPPFGDKLTVKPVDVVQINTTGGTSGKGREIYGLTANDVALVSRLFAQGCVAAGVRAGDTVAMTFPMSLGAAPLWIYNAFVRLGTNIMCLGSYDTPTKLKLIKEFGARVLIATPSYIEALGAAASSELGWNLRTDFDVKIILMATESFSLERVRRIEASWGAKVHEWYGATQRIVAFNCECGAVRSDNSRGLLHHSPHLILMETINPVTLEPVEFGEEGEVVATCLDIEASPLLRFATGDCVRLMPADSCPCGSGYDGYESGTIRRYDDMVKVRGINIWPAVTDDVIFRAREIRNYIGTVRNRADGREEVVVEVEFADEEPKEGRRDALNKLASDLRSAVGLRVDVKEASKPLPRFEHTLTKAKRWRDERRS